MDHLRDIKTCATLAWVLTYEINCYDTIGKNKKS